MIIKASEVGLNARSSVSTTWERKMMVRAWVGSRPPDPVATDSGEGGADGRTRPVVDRAVFSEAAREALAQSRQVTDFGIPKREARRGVDKDGNEVALSPQDELKIQLIEGLLSQVLGREVKLKRFHGLDLQPDAIDVPQGQEGSRQPTSGQSNEPNWGFEASVQERTTRTERMDFAAAGKVRTADGKELAFALDLSMERTSVQESSMEVRLGNAVRKDPLVLNFAGNSAELTEKSFSFDLDADGVADSVKLPTGGSAFLARNPGDGLVDGRILFGPSTGDGFRELAALDDDGNGWVDEGDGAWKDLGVWSRSESGQDNFRTLTEAGVGAMYVGSVSTPWEMDGGAVASSGVWLGEPGGAQAAGTIQHVDLTV